MAISPYKKRQLSKEEVPLRGIKICKMFSQRKYLLFGRGLGERFWATKGRPLNTPNLSQ